MTKIVLKDGTEEYLKPGDAKKKVAAGEAVYAQPTPNYTTRRMTAEEPKKAPKKKAPKAKKEKPADEAE